MSAIHVPAWRPAPFLRLITPFVSGILYEWYLRPSLSQLLFTAIPVVAIIICYQLVPVKSRFRWRIWNGIAISLLLATIGAIITFLQDIRHDSNWVGHHYQPGDEWIVKVEGPVSIREHSIKTNAQCYYLIRDGDSIVVKGKLFLYFPVNPNFIPLNGMVIKSSEPLHELPAAGNPYAFDFARYGLFNGTTHQANLRLGSFFVSPVNEASAFSLWLDKIHAGIIALLKQNITGQAEAGLAEALLIGYRDDLDKDLVQSYSNTGVVHIIAISGLHLGLIYGLLLVVLKPIRRHHRIAWLSPLLLIASLWIFSLLAGAQPSVLRSAVMFTCIAAGELFSRKGNMINNLGLSAFLLLCYNPFWLWDAGFQLSYAAVISIVLYSRDVYHWLYFKNKLVDMIWQLNAVTLAAQVMTIPLCIYHFHQFPNYFLFANLVAVPLSSLILFAEIFLCCIAWWPVIGHFTGLTITYLIRWMNAWIVQVEKLPSAIWEGLYINTIQALLLYLSFISICSWWLTGKIKWGFIIGLIAICGFFICRSLSFVQARQQCRIIIYQVPRHFAIDFIEGRHYRTVSDTALPRNRSAIRFHLQPARIAWRLIPVNRLSAFRMRERKIDFRGIRLLMVDQYSKLVDSNSPTDLDILLVTGKCRNRLFELTTHFNIRQLVLSNRVNQADEKNWQKTADSLRIPIHIIREKGAFVMQCR